MKKNCNNLDEMFFKFDIELKGTTVSKLIEKAKKLEIGSFDCLLIYIIRKYVGEVNF
jgi:hypothetical protein